MKTANIPQCIHDALAAYRATLDSATGRIHKGKALPVRIVLQAGRLRFESLEGGLLASGRPDAAFVDTFVQRFWFWSKQS